MRGDALPVDPVVHFPREDQQVILIRHLRLRATRPLPPTSAFAGSASLVIDGPEADLVALWRRLCESGEITQEGLLTL